MKYYAQIAHSMRILFRMKKTTIAKSCCWVKSFPFVFECNFHHPPPKVFWSFWRASSTSSSLLFHLSIKAAFNFLQFFQVIVVTKIVQLRHLRPQFSPQRRTQPQMSTIYRCHFLFFYHQKYIVMMLFLDRQNTHSTSGGLMDKYPVLFLKIKEIILLPSKEM